MKLSFLGARYEAHFESVQTEEGPQIGTYRGAPLKAKSYRVANHPHEKVQLRYRGVTYTK
ncbi:MAG: DUF4278 domain-containing protein [Cyanobacteria bacterium J06628_6]